MLWNYILWNDAMELYFITFRQITILSAVSPNRGVLVQLYSSFHSETLDEKRNIFRNRVVA